MKFKLHDFFHDPRKIALSLLILALGAAVWVSRAGAQTPAMAARSYYVSNASAFPGLPWAQNMLIFRNGLLQWQGLDYSVSGSSFRMCAGCLQNGDELETLVLPGAAGAGVVPSITGPATASWTTAAVLPTPTAALRGHELLITGSGSIADSLFICRYNGTAYVWSQVPLN